MKFVLRGQAEAATDEVYAQVSLIPDTQVSSTKVFVCCMYVCMALHFSSYCLFKF